MGFDKDASIRLICRRRDFYKEPDKNFEWGPFKILAGLMKRGQVTPEEVDDALWE